MLGYKYKNLTTLLCDWRLQKIKNKKIKQRSDREVEVKKKINQWPASIVGIRNRGEEEGKRNKELRTKELVELSAPRSESADIIAYYIYVT